MALDIVRLARSGACDVALLFSQDQDLSEVADEMRAIALGQGRWIKMAMPYCAPPSSASSRSSARPSGSSPDSGREGLPVAVLLTR